MLRGVSRVNDCISFFFLFFILQKNWGGLFNHNKAHCNINDEMGVKKNIIEKIKMLSLRCSWIIIFDFFWIKMSSYWTKKVFYRKIFFFLNVRISQRSRRFTAQKVGINIEHLKHLPFWIFFSYILSSLL